MLSEVIALVTYDVNLVIRGYGDSNDQTDTPIMVLSNGFDVYPL